ncbi:MAG: laccase domain-containing protein [Gammaproteobacteria bacterium]
MRAQFLQLDAANHVCFKPSPTGRWLADIYALARRQLQDLGITAVYGGDWCTVSDPARFYSYRRDGSSGRMASLIWLQA